MCTPPEVLDYVILRNTRTELSQTVREMLRSGWQPLGPPYLYADQDTGQAMVKYRVPKEEVAEEDP